MLLYYKILLLVGDIAGGGFIALYMYYFPGWRKSDIGKLLLTFSAVVFLFYAWYTVLVFWPSIPRSTREVVRLALFTLMTLALVDRLIRFFVVKEKIRRRDAAMDKEPIPDA